MKQKVYVLYHGSGCYDGFIAAYSAWKKLSKRKDLDVSYLSVDYNKPYPLSDSETSNSIFYIVDFSYPKDVLIKIHSLAKSLTVLDHHKSAQQALQGLDFAHFDMNRSGAMMSWNYFHGNKNVPKLIEYVQDRDLWLWKLKYSREINAVIQSYSVKNLDENFKQFDKLRKKMEFKTNLKQFQKEGSAILRAQDRAIERAIDLSLTFKEVGGYKQIPTVNTPLFASEICNYLLKVYPEAPFAAAFYEETEKETVWSLRGRGVVDVSAVAATFGGGGHFNASGFTVKK